MGTEDVNRAMEDNLTQAVTLTPTKWEILPGTQTVRLTATGSDSKTYVVAIPTTYYPK